MSAFNWDNEDEFFTDEWTSNVVYKTKTYKGIIFEKETANEVEKAGMSVDIVFSMMFRVKDFAVLPSIGELMVLDGEELRIKRILKGSTGKTFTIDFVEKFG